MLWGAERLEERLGEVEFSLSPRAFFQLNPEQTIKLYNSVQEAAALEGSELVVDAYCGTGTIGLWLAPHAGEVRGIEVIPEAVRDARDNARTSSIENALFYEGRAEQLLPEWVAQGFRPDVIVVDPPRTGCEPSLLKAVAEARPKRFVYVSCNPSTLAKDCKTLLASGYQLEWVQPVDMFPQTSHVECVVGICRVDT
jgi:23S rRNA (uracil1939-C5)-methyltransferase